LRLTLTTQLSLFTSLDQGNGTIQDWRLRVLFEASTKVNGREANKAIFLEHIVLEEHRCRKMIQQCYRKMNLNC
jgi:hypothetical protein